MRASKCLYCAVFAAVLFVSILTGCDSVLTVFTGGVGTTTVRLVNNGDFDVHAQVAISDEDDIPEDVLDELEDEVEFTIPAGRTTTFVRDCDDLQAIMVVHAELRVLEGIGPEADSKVLRDHDDFSCGDVIVFTFTHSDVILDFDVSSSVE